MTPMICTVTIPNDMASVFVGDVDFFVADDGALLVYDYGVRKDTNGSGLVFSASPGFWAQCTLKRLPETEA